MRNHPQIKVGKLVPDPLIKNQNWAYLCINNLKCYKVFLVYVQDVIYQNIIKVADQLLLFYVKYFWKTKRCLELPHFLKLPYLIFCMIFQEKYFSRYILLTDQIICCSVREIKIFVVSHRFLIKSFFWITKKSVQKCKYLKNVKRFQHEIKRIFHYF